MRLKTAGCDPEILFQCRHSLCFVSAEGMLPGTKSNPYPVNRGSVQVDNVCGEFNTDPVSSATDFNSVVAEVCAQMLDMVADHGLVASRESVADYPVTEHSMLAGCDPDWNAYTLRLNPIPDYVSNTLRSAGGHLHFGIDVSREEVIQLVKACDLLITAPMLRFEDERRRKFYGRAGSFRLKPYGVEYRTPSNLWVFGEDTRLWVYQQMERAAATFNEYDIPDSLGEIIDNHRIDFIDSYLDKYHVDAYPQPNYN